jgi:hypothetical protein
LARPLGRGGGAAGRMYGPRPSPSGGRATGAFPDACAIPRGPAEPSAVPESLPSPEDGPHPRAQAPRLHPGPAAPVQAGPSPPGGGVIRVGGVSGDASSQTGPGLRASVRHAGGNLAFGVDCFGPIARGRSARYESEAGDSELAPRRGLRRSTDLFTPSPRMPLSSEGRLDTGHFRRTSRASGRHVKPDLPQSGQNCQTKWGPKPPSAQPPVFATARTTCVLSRPGPAQRHRKRPGSWEGK